MKDYCGKIVRALGLYFIEIFGFNKERSRRRSRGRSSTA